MKKLTKQYLKTLTYEIINSAIEVHKEIGPGLLESLYEDFMFEELTSRGFKVKRQQKVPVVYKGKTLETQLRYDLLVDDCIVVELKAVLEMHPVFEAQIMTYTRLLKVPKGILINFNVTNIFYKGQKTFVNEYFRELPEK